jgi:hypothetical protein
VKEKILKKWNRDTHQKLSRRKKKKKTCEILKHIKRSSPHFIAAIPEDLLWLWGRSSRLLNTVEHRQPYNAWAFCTRVQ